MIIPAMIFSVANSTRKVKMVVSVPAPAISGNAIGTIEPELEPSVSLKRVIPKTISIPKKNKIKEPATANELTSTPNSPSTLSPKNKNKIIIDPATKVAFPDSIFIPLFFMSKTIGIEPIISITENKINETERISFGFNTIPDFFCFLKSSAKVELIIKVGNRIS
jgi:hypothetical protein